MGARNGPSSPSFPPRLWLVVGANGKPTSSSEVAKVVAGGSIAQAPAIPLPFKYFVVPQVQELEHCSTKKLYGGMVNDKRATSSLSV